MSRPAAITITRRASWQSAYHTLGPDQAVRVHDFHGPAHAVPATPGGVSREWYAMWPEREGGNLALIEGTMTFKKDTPIDDMNLLWLQLQNFPKDGSNIPLFGIRRNNDSLPICGPQQSVYVPGVGIPPSLGLGQSARIPSIPAAISPSCPTGEGIASALFNVGAGPMCRLRLGRP